VSFLFADPEALVTAVSDLSGIGSTLSAANAVASAPTMGVAAAAADGVSAQVAAFFSQHGLGYQQISAQIANFHDEFVQTLSAGASTYAAAEANAAQTLVNAVNAPAATLLGHPLLGSGASVGAVGGAAGGFVSNALGRIETVLGNNFLGAAGLPGSSFPGGSGLVGGVAQEIGAASQAGSNALGRIETVLGSNFLGGAGLVGSGFLGGPGLLGGVAQEIGAASQAGTLLLGPTGAVRALTAASALLAPAAMTNAAAVPAANAFAPIGNAIEAAYNTIEPWVFYGFQVAQYAVGYLPWIGLLAPQITIFYNLFEPMVQAGLFNILDWLGGSITFAQGLSNFIGATTASINYFINNEINWFLSFLPPLPPLPPLP
jgi:hypothetical protein